MRKINRLDWVADTVDKKKDFWGLFFFKFPGIKGFNSGEATAETLLQRWCLC